MKNRLKALSLTMIASAPLLLGQIAMAQDLMTPDTEVRLSIPANQVMNEPPMLVAQDSEQVRRQQRWQAYASSGYTYNDATLLANFWGKSISEAKDRIGVKTILGSEGKMRLTLFLADARTKALGNVDSLELYSQSGFSYRDAEAMATFWGDPSPWDGKLRIERNLILGNDDTVRSSIQIIHDYEAGQKD